MNAIAPAIRLRFTLAQLLSLVILSTLCMAPLMASLKSGKGMLILAAVTLDVFIAPMIETVIVMAYVRSPERRDWIVRAIWVIPSLFVGAFLTVLVPILLFVNDPFSR